MDIFRGARTKEYEANPRQGFTSVIILQCRTASSDASLF